MSREHGDIKGLPEKKGKHCFPNGGTKDEHWESHGAAATVGFGTALERAAE